MRPHKIIIASEVHRARVLDIIRSLPIDPAYEVSIREYRSTRNLEQNARMWAMLTDISNQVDWHGNKLSKEEWKDVFTASLKRQKVVPGMDGGFVVIGARTSTMTIAEMSDLIECAMAFGSQHGVRWSDPE